MAQHRSRAIAPPDRTDVFPRRRPTARSTPDPTAAGRARPEVAAAPEGAHAEPDRAAARERMRGRAIDHLPLLAVLVLLGGIAAIDLLAAGWIAASLGPAHRGATPVPGVIAAASPTAVIGGSATPGSTSSPPTAPLVAVAPTPAPTSAPTANPTAAPAAGPTPPPVATDPAQAVLAFYHAVALHQWSAAIALWTPSMQQRYPPDENIVARFTPTTAITIRNLGTTRVDRAAGTATVAVTVIEQRTVAPNPLVSTGSWDLIAIDGRWLLDQPHF